MKVQLAHILQNLFHTSSLDEVPLERLQEIVKDHPYFSTGYFLLAQKLKQDDSEQYGDAVQKTALYFHDPLWLHWQLNLEKKETIAVKNAGIQMPISVEEKADIPGPDVVEEEIEQFKENPVEQIDTVQTEETIEPITAINANEAPLHDEIIVQDKLDAQDETGQSFSTANEWEHPAETIEEINIPPINEEQINETPDEHLEHPAELITEDRDHTPEPVEETVTDKADYLSQPEIDPAIERPEEISEPAAEPVSTVEQPEIPENGQSVETDSVEPDKTVEPVELSRQTPEPITRPSHQTITPEFVNENATPAFDPYYTIDYFASQGIKVSLDVQPGDKLGKQLKSFTEWLKTMKRLPQTQPEEQTETEQQHIRQFAAGSLEQKEVVTETMAEVLIKQEKKGEAIAIYEKLSLLDPSKRAYFAAKIENLKSELI